MVTVIFAAGPSALAIRKEETEEDRLCRNGFACAAHPGGAAIAFFTLNYRPGCWAPRSPLARMEGWS